MATYHRVPSSSAADPSSASPAESTGDLRISSSVSSHHHNGGDASSSSSNPRTSAHAVASASSSAHASSSFNSASSSHSRASNNNSGLRRTWSERWNDKWMAVLWVMVALLVAHFSRFTAVVTMQAGPAAAAAGATSGNSTGTSPSINDPKLPVRWLMQLAGLLLLGVVVSWLYLVLYLPFVKGLTDPSAWPVYCPRVVPGMVVTLLVAFVVLIRACWPVWGCLSPLVWMVEIVGALYATHLVPWSC